MATNENCIHQKKVNLPALRNRIEKSGFDKFCGMCALDPTAQSGSAGGLRLCLSCGSQLCDQDMKLHALLHHGVPRTDVHALAMNTDSFAVRCYCCNVPVVPQGISRILEIVDCLVKLAEARGSINPPRGILHNPFNESPELQCLARTPFLVTLLKKRVTYERIDIPGGVLKLSNGQEIQLPTMEQTALPNTGFLKAMYHVLNELLSGATNCISLDKFSPKFKLVDWFEKYLTLDDDRYRSQLKVLIDIKYYNMNSTDNKSILDFYYDQLLYTPNSHTKVFRGTRVNKTYCQKLLHSRWKIEHFDQVHIPFHLKGVNTIHAYLKKKLSVCKSADMCSECNKNGENAAEYVLHLIVEPPPVLIMRCFYGSDVLFPFVLDITQYCNPIERPEQKMVLYALYGVTFLEQLGKHAAYVKVRPPLGTDDARWKFLSHHSKDDLQIIAERAADLMGHPLRTDDEKENVPEQEDPEVQPPPGKWYYVFDTVIREVPDEQEVLKVKPAILYYERIA